MARYNPVGEIGSGYPTNVYDASRFSLPILRQNMAEPGCIMFIDLPDGYFYGDQNTWNTFLVSEQKISLSNQMTHNEMKPNKQNRHRSEFEIQQNKLM
jgi:hypothetical protein